MRDELIFHLVPKDDWKEHQDSGVYRPDTLEEDGFIHCSTGKQVQQVANRRFPGRDDLLLLIVDVAGLESDVKMETAESGEEAFPHIYGPLNIDAIIDKISLEPQEDGSFYIEFDSTE
ncbi:MAG: DUF952 domain-containing protein [Balneolaceae bacterium]|nr:DUF952 domain-containing protein [Balneolaceae bacterium]